MTALRAPDVRAGARAVPEGSAALALLLDDGISCSAQIGDQSSKRLVSIIAGCPEHG
jgi:hypothetical protein